MMNVIVVPPFVPYIMLKYFLFGGMITRSKRFPCLSRDGISASDALSKRYSLYSIPFNLSISSLAVVALRVHNRIEVVSYLPYSFAF